MPTILNSWRTELLFWLSCGLSLLTGGYASEPFSSRVWRGRGKYRWDRFAFTQLEIILADLKAREDDDEEALLLLTLQAILKQPPSRLAQLFFAIKATMLKLITAPAAEPVTPPAPRSPAPRCYAPRL